MDTAETTVEKKSGSIIPERFQSKNYKGAQDWVNSFITSQISDYKTIVKKSKDAEGNEVEESYQRVDGMNNDKLVALAQINGVDTSKINLSERNAPGRARMTWGNSLRAKARADKGLKDLDGNFVLASDEFIASIPEKKPRPVKVSELTEEQIVARKEKQQANFAKMQAASKVKRIRAKAAKETRDLTDEEAAEIVALQEQFGLSS